MPGEELFAGSNVQDDDVAPAGPLHQLGPTDGFEGVAGHEVVPHDLVHIGEAGAGQVAQRGHLVAGQPVVDLGGFPLRVSTKPAWRRTCKWAEVFVTPIPVTSASASTLRSPWASTSSSSIRLGLATALAARANCSYKRSLASRPFTPAPSSLFQRSLDHATDACSPGPGTFGPNFTRIIPPTY